MVERHISVPQLNLAGKIIFIPLNATLNGTERIFTKTLQKHDCTVLYGKSKNAQKERIWEHADIIIPPTRVSPETLKERLEEIDNDSFSEELNDALILAQTYHHGQIRKSGSDYFTGHILPVTLYTALVQSRFEHKLSEEVLISCILHDIVEDSEETIIALESERKHQNQVSLELLFGNNIATNVAALTKKPKEFYEQEESRQQYNHLSDSQKWALRNQEYSEQILHASLDIKLIKCADRILNIADDILNLSNNHEKEFVLEYVEETKRFYVPLFDSIYETHPMLRRTLFLLIEILQEQLKD